MSYFCTEAAIAEISTGQKWYNELGSEMIITSYDSQTGVFFGSYNSKVGDAEKWYDLTGRKDTEGNTVGWTVNWQNSHNNAHSVTTWSGQIQLSLKFADPVIQIIQTTWLLTSQTTPVNNWDSTLVGFDYFSNTKPSQENVDQAMLRCRKSHPKDVEN